MEIKYKQFSLGLKQFVKAIKNENSKLKNKVNCLNQENKVLIDTNLNLELYGWGRKQL